MGIKGSAKLVFGQDTKDERCWYVAVYEQPATEKRSPNHEIFTVKDQKSSYITTSRHLYRDILATLGLEEKGFSMNLSTEPVETMGFKAYALKLPPESKEEGKKEEKKSAPATGNGTPLSGQRDFIHKFNHSSLNKRPWPPPQPEPETGEEVEIFDPRQPAY